MSEIYKNRHAAFNLHVHLVFITKQRKKVLGKLHHDYFSECASEVCDIFDAELTECSGKADYVHMLIQYPPTVQLSKLVNNLKSVTSRRMRGKFVDLTEAYDEPVLWSRSYFASSCGGESLDIIEQYIQNQKS